MKKNIKRFACTAGLIAMSTVCAVAQQYGDASKINEGLQEATDTVKGVFGTIVGLLYAVCAIMACIGAFQVYSKWSSGDPDVTKSAAGWIGGIIFVIVAIIIIFAELSTA